MTTEEILHTAISHFGQQSQITKSMEELSELLVHLAKFSHAPERYADKSEIIDEIADVSIMAQQLAIIFGKERVQERIEYKLGRLADNVL